MTPAIPGRIDRREAIKWMLTAAASTAFARRSALSAPAGEAAPAAAPGVRFASAGYGSDPDLMKDYKLGDYWPLTFTEQQRRTAAALCGTIIPADERSPSASDLAVHDFIDEWISAPYPGHDTDRTVVTDGLAWIDAEAARRFSHPFSELAGNQREAICNDLCPAEPAEAFREAGKFFARFRDLTAGGFYTTPEGAKDLQYVGNVPLGRFDGPPLEVLQKVGLA